MDFTKADNVGDLILMALMEGQGEVVKDVHDVYFSYLALLGVILGLSTAFYGLAIMITNKGKEEVFDLGKMLLLIVTATTFVHTGGYEWFFDLAMELRVKISIFLLPQSAGTIFSAISGTFESLYALGAATYDNGDIMGDSMPMLIGIVTMLSCLIYYLCILCNLLVCEMMLLVLYLLGSFVIVTAE